MLKPAISGIDAVDGAYANIAMCYVVALLGGSIDPKSKDTRHLIDVAMVVIAAMLIG
jgi:MFS superfamily sulfate permease-like transporter